jgi:branched-chain amino acid aminotransferase
MSQLWCNGQWLGLEEFPVSSADRGLTHGLALFETLLAIDGLPVFLARHLARLRNGMARLGWEMALPDLRIIIAELLQRNQLGSGRARVRFTISAGSGPMNDLALGQDHLLWVTAFPALDVPENLSVCISPWRRNEHSPLAGLKCASYAENLIALDHARRQGCEETIFLNTAGELCEAAMANLFLVKNGMLQTPPLASGCLPGVTREVVLELASHHGINCEERILNLDDFRAADEAFLTSSTKGPVPVSGKSGPCTNKIRQLWSQESMSDLAKS